MFSSSRQDYYQILGVLSTASQQEIKKAYRKRAFQLHPDKNPDRTATEQFQALQKAYDTLSDPDKRVMYRPVPDKTTEIPDDDTSLPEEDRYWPSLAALMLKFNSAINTLLSHPSAGYAEKSMLFDSIEAMRDEVRKKFHVFVKKYTAEFERYAKKRPKNWNPPTLQDRSYYENLIAIADDIVNLTQRKMSPTEFRKKHTRSTACKILCSLVIGIAAAAIVFFAAAHGDYHTACTVSAGVVSAGITFWKLGNPMMEKIADAMSNIPQEAGVALKF